MTDLLLDRAQVAGEAVLGGVPGVWVSAHLAPGYWDDRFAVEGLLLQLRDRLPAGDAVLRAEWVELPGRRVLLLTMGVAAVWPAPVLVRGAGS